MGLLSIGIALFAVQNSMSVEINFMFWTFTTSLVLVILGCFVAGILLAGLWILKIKTKNYLRRRKNKEYIAQLENQVKELEEKVGMQRHVDQQKVKVSGRDPEAERIVQEIINANQKKNPR
jgi:uncharacterized integral membrane protein